MKKENKIIWTIGHCTRPFEEFVAMLHSFNIELVADLRSYPGSRRVPQFNTEELEISLPQNDIQYVHLKNLGGRRKVSPDSKNKGWRHAAFRGYAGMSPYYDFGLFKAPGLESNALNGDGESRRTFLHNACKNCKWGG